MTFTELKELILDNKLAEKFKNEKEKFEELINSEVETPNYYSEAIKFLKNNRGEYTNPESLVRGLGGLGFSDITIKKHADRCLKNKIGLNFSELQDLTKY